MAVMVGCLVDSYMSHRHAAPAMARVSLGPGAPWRPGKVENSLMSQHPYTHITSHICRTRCDFASCQLPAASDGVLMHGTRDLHAPFDMMKKQVEAQEMELMESRLHKTAELNGTMEEEVDDAGQYRFL
ncbi:hypothetical protein NHX12_010691 [Muraenolepis orangiensis]|uniref:Uncharacterized protein n=1 Tax=Muraenolepis orangiensis TaxID=630683 RepID=A0A9Q0DMR3_9TELE|nr:hypothetical protein NHX12_010691 [Muraenolepis orangiensis]